MKRFLKIALGVVLVGMVALAVLAVAVPPVTDPSRTEADEATGADESPMCAPPDPCWGELHYNAGSEPCWRAIEAEAGKLGRAEWAGIGRLISHRSLANGNVLYFGERMEVVGGDGLRRLYHYTCIYVPETGEVTVPVLDVGPLP